MDFPPRHIHSTAFYGEIICPGNAVWVQEDEMAAIMAGADPGLSHGDSAKHQDPDDAQKETPGNSRNAHIGSEFLTHPL